jgi:hypothetical protein
MVVLIGAIGIVAVVILAIILVLRKKPKAEPSKPSDQSPPTQTPPESHSHRHHLDQQNQTLQFKPPEARHKGACHLTFFIKSKISLFLELHKLYKTNRAMSF